VRENGLRRNNGLRSAETVNPNSTTGIHKEFFLVMPSLDLSYEKAKAPTPDSKPIVFS
jgi:hypothetical protein